MSNLSRAGVRLARKLKEQAQTVRHALATLSQVAAAFKGRYTQKRLQQTAEILDMLVALGQAHLDENDS